MNNRKVKVNRLLNKFVIFRVQSFARLHGVIFIRVNYFLSSERKLFRKINCYECFIRVS